MCIGCWNKLGSPRIDTPQIRQTAADIKEHYETHLAGGGLHVQLDDWNLGDEFFDGDYYRRGEDGWWSSAADRIVAAMEQMTVEERASALALAEGFWSNDLIDAAENVLIAYGMGWGLEGVMARLEKVLENWHVSDTPPSDRSPDDR